VTGLRVGSGTTVTATLGADSVTSGAITVHL
jgi:hypothetical protein